ncbi:DUF3231 family protein [Tuberibacillus sp. Marseille-P3662]|uniref:DUF3231 family protein n=1 Tax=Tuberibacillus sp. Marseille-P3662 TaxID=1965358 RepID=UPI000A1C902A|nr:DUF3231 family protein [Tuberibacillus sp. Marseille-P3662]
MTQKRPLTASEKANLWVSYQNDTMAMCGIEYFLSNVEDKAIHSLLQYALSISRQHIRRVKHIFTQEEFPIPVGFTKQDVNLDAPRLFSDKLYLYYLVNMGKFGLSSYSLALSLASRQDVIDYYSDCLEQTKKLHNRGKKLAMEKGVFQEAPSIPNPEQVDFVKKQSFLAGWIGEQRPLLAIEIANLVYNAKRNTLGEALITGFAQVARDKAVIKYFKQGRELANRHLETFSSLLKKDSLSTVDHLSDEVTDSTNSPFSDKLMMYHVSTLIASGIGQYGVAMAASPRHDLSVHYARLTAEITKYANDGANIMINYGWMEQPPEAPNRKELVKKQEKE